MVGRDQPVAAICLLVPSVLPVVPSVPPVSGAGAGVVCACCCGAGSGVVFGAGADCVRVGAGVVVGGVVRASDFGGVFVTGLTWIGFARFAGVWAVAWR